MSNNKSVLIPMVALLISGFSAGFVAGGVLCVSSVMRKQQQEAVAAGVAEWVLVADKSGGKPSFEFRYKTPPQSE